MAEKDLFSDISSVHITNPKINTLALHIIKKEIQKFTDHGNLREDDDFAGEFRMVLHCMREQSFVEDVQESGLTIIQYFLNNEDTLNSRNCVTKEDFSTLMDIITNILINFSKNEHLVAGALLTIQSQLSNQWLLSCLNEATLKCIVNNLPFTNDHVVNLSLHVLSALLPITSGSFLVDLTIEDKLHEFICQKLRAIVGGDWDSFVVQCCLDVLLDLACLVGYEMLNRKNKLLQTILKILHSTDHQIQIELSCYKLLIILVPLKHENQKENRFIVSHLHSSMIRYTDNADAQKICCHLIISLLKHCPRIQHHIGEDIGQYPLHTICFGVLLFHPNDIDLKSTACNALYWLAFHNDEIQEALVMKNVHFELEAQLRHSVKDPILVACACEAVRGLCIYNKACKAALVESGIVSALLDVLIPFSAYPESLVESLCALACLAEIETARKLCVKEGLVHLILQWMGPDLLNEKNVMEICMEILAVLNTGINLRVMRETGTLVAVLDIMSQYPESEAMQLKGLILIQLILDCLRPFPIRLGHDLAQIITRCMKIHHQAESIMSEVLVCILMSCELGKHEIGQHFIDSEVIECLFNCYSNGGSDIPAIKKLLIRCLIVICYDLDLLSTVLLQACRDGQEKIAETMLLLGANVNTGSGTNSPLCHAILQRNFYLVELLLEKGIRNFEPAIKLCQELELHHYLGLLLSHCGVDAENGAISWSGLGLGNIKLEWICPSLIGPLRTRKHRVMEHSSQIAEQIKTSCSSRIQDNRISRLSSSECLMRFTEDELQFGCYGEDIQTETLGGQTTSFLQTKIRLEVSMSSVWSDSGDANSVASSLDDVSPCSPDAWKRLSLSGSNIPFARCDPRIPLRLLRKSPDVIRKISTDDPRSKSPGANTVKLHGLFTRLKIK